MRRPMRCRLHAATGILVLANLILLAACAGGSRDAGHGPAAKPAAGDTIETALQHAEAAFKDGDYEEAQVAYEAAIAIRPDHPQAIVGLANCCIKNRQVRRARGARRPPGAPPREH